jgi:hypothetical protein
LLDDACCVSLVGDSDVTSTWALSRSISAVLKGAKSSPLVPPLSDAVWASSIQASARRSLVSLRCRPRDFACVFSASKIPRSICVRPAPAGQCRAAPCGEQRIIAAWR